MPTDRWSDGGLCAAVTVAVQAVVWLGPPMPGLVTVNAAVGLAMTLPLLVRRSRPLPMLAVVVTALVTQALAYGGTESAAVLVPFLVAVYSAAVYGNPAYVVGALALLGIVLHDVRDPLVTSASQAWFSPCITSVVLVVGRVVHRRHQQTAAAEARAVRAEQEREAAVRDAVAAEQRRIGRELHDVVAHSLSVMALQAGAAEQVLDRSPDSARAALRVIRETGHEAVREMGRLLSLDGDGDGEGDGGGDGGGDRGPQPLPTMAALPGLVERARAAGLSTDLVVEGAVRPLPPALELALFRIGQEGLTNALKHAPAARTTVGYCYGSHDVTVEVVTTGPTPGSGGGTGRGLAGLAERVSFAGGRLDVGPRDGGWRLRAVLPVPS